MARKLIVEVVGDASSLERTFGRAERSARRFGRTMEHSGRGITTFQGRVSGLGRSLVGAGAAFLAAGGIVEGIKTSIEAASDLEEQMAKVNVVFGDSAAAVETWSETTANSIGIARDQALQFAGSFGALLRPIGLTGKQSSVVSRQLVQLGADLASFYNTDVQDALDAITSGIVGQVRPLRRYGVLLSAARVNALALAQTGKKSTTELTDQEKVLARIAILFHDSALAQGDFARTSQHAAQQQKIATANIANLKEELGGALLPVVTEYLRKLNRWFSDGQNVENLSRRFAKVLGAVGQFATFAANTITGLVGALGGWRNALGIAIGAWAGFKVAGMGAATAILVANIAAAEGTAAAWRAALISTGWGAFAVAAGIAAGYVVTHWEKVKVWFQLFWVDLEKMAYVAARKIVEPFSHLPRFLGGWARERKEALTGAIRQFEYEKVAIRTRAMLEENARKKREAARKKEVRDAFHPPKLPKYVPPKIVGAGGTGPTAEDLRNRRIEQLQLAVDAAEATKTLRDDLKALRALQDYLKRQVGLHRKNLDLRRQLLDVNKQIADVMKQQREQQAAARQARQFRELGLGPTGEELVPGLKGLQRQLASVRERVLGSFLDTKKTRSLLAHIRRVLSGGLGAVGREVRQKIAEILADLTRQLKEHQGTQTEFAKTTRNMLLGGLGLSPHQRRALQARLAMLGPGGVAPSPSGQFAGAGATGGMYVAGDVHVHGVRNVKELEQQLMKRSKQRAHMRRSSR